MQSQESIVWSQSGTPSMVHSHRQLSQWIRLHKSEANVNLYHIVVDGKLFILVLYVAYLILTHYENIIFSFKEYLAREFEMKYMVLMHYFVRLEVWKGDGEFFVSHKKYASEILQIFHVESCKHMDTPLATNWRKENATSCEEVDATTYRKLVGFLMYLVNT